MGWNHEAVPTYRIEDDTCSSPDQRRHESDTHGWHAGLIRGGNHGYVPTTSPTLLYIYKFTHKSFACFLGIRQFNDSWFFSPCFLSSFLLLHFIGQKSCTVQSSLYLLMYELQRVTSVATRCNCGMYANSIGIAYTTCATCISIRINVFYTRKKEKRQNIFK